MPKDDFWYNQGVNGGSRPNNSDSWSYNSGSGLDAWNKGNEQRQFDNFVKDYCNTNKTPDYSSDSNIKKSWD